MTSRTANSTNTVPPISPVTGNPPGPWLTGDPTDVVVGGVATAGADASTDTTSWPEVGGTRTISAVQ